MRIFIYHHSFVVKSPNLLLLVHLRRELKRGENNCEMMCTTPRNDREIKQENLGGKNFLSAYSVFHSSYSMQSSSSLLMFSPAKWNSLVPLFFLHVFIFELN